MQQKFQLTLTEMIFQTSLKNDGSLYVWGTNSDSLLVSTSTEDVLPLPSKMELSVDGQVLDVAAGGGTNSSG